MASLYHDEVSEASKLLHNTVSTDGKRETGAATASHSNRRWDTLYNQVQGMKKEISHREQRFQQHRLLLEQTTRQHESQYQLDTDMLHQKLSALMEEAQSHDHHDTTLNQTYLDHCTKLQSDLDQERSERAEAMMKLSRQLSIRDEQVEALKKLLVQQNDKIKLANMERDDMKNEIKSVLAFQNVQFEHLMCLATKQRDETTMMREESGHALEKVAEFACSLDAALKDVAQVQTAAIQRKVKEAVAVALTGVGVECKKAWMEQQDDLLHEVQSLGNSLETVASEVTKMRYEQKLSRQEQEKFDCSAKKTDESVKLLEEELLQTKGWAKDLDDTMLEVRAQGETMLDSVTGLCNEFQNHVKAQSALNAKAKEKVDKQKDNLKVACASIDATNVQVSQLLQNLENQKSYQTVTEQQLNKSLAEIGTQLAERKKKSADCESRFDELLTKTRHRDEAQALAYKDLWAKYAGMEQQVIESLKLAGQLPTQSVNHTVMQQIVQKMVQPLLEQQNSLGETVAKQTESVTKTSADFRAAIKATDVIAQKVDTANKTWESLFQHLANQVKIDVADMLIAKQKSEIVQQDVKAMILSWEKTLYQMSTSAPSNDVTAALRGHKLGMDSMQSKIEAHHSQMSTLAGNLEEQRSKLMAYHLQYQQSEEKMKEWNEALESSNRLENHGKEAFRIAMRADLKVEKLKAICKSEFSKSERVVKDLQTSIEDQRDEPDTLPMDQGTTEKDSHIVRKKTILSSECTVPIYYAKLVGLTAPQAEHESRQA